MLKGIFFDEQTFLSTFLQISIDLALGEEADLIKLVLETELSISDSQKQSPRGVL